MNKLQDHVALITGGTDGIGKEVARGLAQRGASVMIVGRNEAKGAATAAEINQAAGRQAVKFVAADLSLMSQARRLAEDFRQHHDRLDVLVHSAGVIHTGFDKTDEGFETNVATDYLSRFLLTHLLLDLLKSSAPARIINIAAAGGKAKLDFQNLRKPKYGGMRALGQAQSANEVFTLALAKRIEDSGVQATAIHPGAVDTNIRRQFPGWLNSLMGLVLSRMVMSPAEGAELPLWLATEAENVNGKLFKPERQEIQPQASLLDPEQQRRLWQISAELVGLQESQNATVK